MAMDLVNTNEYDEDQSSKLEPGKHRTTKYIRRIGDANWNNQPAYKAIGNQPGNEPVWPTRPTNAPTPRAVLPEVVPMERVKNAQIQGYKVPIDPETKQPVTPDDPRYNTLMKRNLATGRHDPLAGVELMPDVTTLRPMQPQARTLQVAQQNVPYWQRQGSMGNVPDYISKQVMTEFGNTYATKWPAIGKAAKSLDEYDRAFTRIADAVPGAGAMIDQIKKDYYEKWMPTGIRAEYNQRLMAQQMEQSGLKEKYDILPNGTFQIKPEYEAKKRMEEEAVRTRLGEESAARTEARQFELQKRSLEHQTEQKRLTEQVPPDWGNETFRKLTPAAKQAIVNRIAKKEEQWDKALDEERPHLKGLKADIDALKAKFGLGDEDMAATPGATPATTTPTTPTAPEGTVVDTPQGRMIKRGNDWVKM